MAARSRISSLMVAAFAALAASCAAAAELDVAVVGADGQPVVSAVVMLRSKAATAPQRAAPVTVDQMGKQFKPWVQVLRVGTPVRFANHDDITHHVYSFSPAKRFAYRLQSGEVQGPLDFDAPGVVVLGCNIHDWMVGYLFVTDAPRSLVTGTDGHARFDALSPGEWQVQVWHPGLTASAAPPDRGVTLAADDQLAISLKLAASLRETGPRQPLAGSNY